VILISDLFAVREVSFFLVPISLIHSFLDLLDDLLMQDFVAGYKKVGGGGFLTEYGASYDDPAAIQQIDEMCNDADSFLQSWAWWQFKDFNDITTASEGPLESFYDADGQLQMPKVKALSRTYAYAISGLPTAMSFDTKSANFTLQYSPNPSISQPTLIYLNQQWYYPNGFYVAITPSTVTWKQIETNRIAVVHPSSISPSVTVSVKIFAK
jgi:endoglycosylceramidase